MLRRSRNMLPHVPSTFILLLAVAFNQASSFSASAPPPSPVPRRQEPPRKLSIDYMNRIRNARGWKAGGSVLLDIENDGYAPNVFHYSAIISKCAKQKQVKKALGFLKRMLNQGVAPNAIVFAAAIDACAKAGQYKRAMSLLNEMEDKYGVHPNEECYSSAISACEKGGQADVALSLLREMEEEGIQADVTSYSSAISACEKGGDKYTDSALSLFVEMKEARVNPDDVTYTAITQACFHSKRYCEALKLAREAVDGDIWLIKLFMENGSPNWDLHGLREAMACMLLADALFSFVRTGNGDTPQNFQDVVVVTGKGLNTVDLSGAVLREKVPAFLNEIAGLETTAIDGNEGRFLITAASLGKWVASGAFEEFKGLFHDCR